MSDLHDEQDARGCVYVWAADGDAYRAASERDLAHGIPVLAPAEMARRARFRDILRWYGLTEVDALPARRGANRATAPDHLVIAIGPAYRDVAVSFARATGRSLCSVASVSEALARIRDAQARSVTLVGAPEHFAAGDLCLAANGIEVPWGILTGRDLAACSLLAAKQLYEPPAAGTGLSGFIDAIHRRMGLLSGWELSVAPTTRAHVATALREREWQHLCMLAHGEGAHVNLDEHVLCGLAGDVERTLDGAPVDGCRALHGDDDDQGAETTAPWCRRLANHTVTPLLVRQLRVHTLHFLSCNGFSTAGELAPTDVSVALAASEGYIGRLLTTDRPIAYESSVPPLMLALAAQGVGPGALAQLENQIREHTDQSRPYLVLGDPVGRPVSWLVPDQAGHLEVPASLAVAVRLPAAWAAREDEPVLAFTTPQGRLAQGLRAARRGRDMCVFLFEQPSARVLVLSDRRQLLEAWAQELGELARRVQRAAHIERTMRHVFGAALAASNALRHAASELASQRTALERILHAMSETIERIRRQGIWDPSLPRLVAAMRQHRNAWDRTFAHLMADHLLAGAIDALHLGGASRERTFSDAGPGMRTVRVEVARHPLDPGVELYRSTCSVQGFRETWSALSPRVEAVLHGPWGAGVTARITIALCGERPHDAPVWLALRAKDKGRGTLFFQHLVAVHGDVSVLVPVPPDLRADLHTLQIGVVAGLDFAACRLRKAWTPLLPALDDAPRGKAAAGRSGLAIGGVLLDLFNTLVTPPPADELHAVMRDHGITEDRPAYRWCQAGLPLAPLFESLAVPFVSARDLCLERRFASIDDAARYLAERTGRTPDRQALAASEAVLAAMLDGCRLAPGAELLLDTLRLRNVPVGLVSNIDSFSLPVIERLGLERFFSAPVLSCDLGARKPGAAIFAVAVERLGIAPERVLMVGDSWTSDVVGALRAGLWPVWLDHGLDAVSRQLADGWLAELLEAGEAGRARFAARWREDIQLRLPVALEAVEHEVPPVALQPHVQVRLSCLARVRRVTGLDQVTQLLFSLDPPAYAPSLAADEHVP